MRPALAALLVLAAGCTETAPPVGGPAPDVTVQTTSGPLRLADARGQQVVLQFAPAGSVEAWAALAAASADLAAEGALVVGVSTDGTPPESPFQVATDEGGAAAAAFGYTGVPLAVVIDRQGVLRGIAAPRQADDLFALAAPVLLEADDRADGPAPPVLGAALDADAVDRLVRDGAALIDLRDAATRAAEGLVRYALICPLGRLAADVLPADIGAPVVLLGPDADVAAAQAAGWGYRNVHVVADASALATGPALAPPTGETATRAERRTAVRG
jgi:peroxiredoxin